MSKRRGQKPFSVPHKKSKNISGQTVTEYILVITILLGLFLSLNSLFLSRVKANFALLGGLFTSDLQTGSGFFNGWKDPEEN